MTPARTQLATTVCTIIACLAFAAATYAVPSGFVHVAGRNFMMDGLPFYFAGANSYNLFTLGDGYSTNTSADIENKFMSKSKIATRMANMASDGVKVVRTWGFSHETWHGFEPAKGVYSEPQFMLFDYILESARMNGIKVIVVLENYWDAYGGIRDRLAWEGLPGSTASNKTVFFSHAGCKAGYSNYVAHFVGRTNHYTGIAYTDDPTIFSWELMNEPRYQGAGEDSTGITLRAWIDEMAAFIKRLDANHMVSAGIEGHQLKYGFGGDEGNPFVYIHQSPYLDFCTAHPYPDESWANLTPTQAGSLVAAWIGDAHNVVGKPFVMEEFNTYSNKTAYWTAMYTKIEQLEAAGDCFWQYADVSKDFDLAHGDPLLASVFRPHADFMAAKSDVIIDQDSGASGITSNSASLNGRLLVSNEVPTYVWIYWGPTDGGTNPVSWDKAILMGIRDAGPFSSNVHGMASDTRYYYRCYASNTVRSAWAKSSASFMTCGVKPVITNNAASSVTDGSAAINGFLLSTGQAPTCVWVYWGTVDGGMVKSNWAHSVDLGMRGIGVVSTNITGLAADTVYYYTYYASNTFAEVWALDSVQFTTASPGAPFVDITNANATVGSAVSTYTLGGTNNFLALGMITWTNTLGGSGKFPASDTGWTFTVSLAVGGNRITARGTNVSGVAHSDNVTITRLSTTPTAYNWSTFLNTAFRTNWNAVENWGSAGFPNIAGDRANSCLTTSGAGGNQFIDLGQNITLGSLYMIDNYGIRRIINAGNTLTFNNVTGVSYLVNCKSGGTLGMQIYADLQLDNDLMITTEAARVSYLGGVISGAGGIVLYHAGATSVLFSATKSSDYNGCPGGAPNNNTGSNTYQGGTILLGAADGVRRAVVADKQGAFGTGSIWLNPHISLRISDGGAIDNRIWDTASLYLYNNATAYARILLDSEVNEIVAGLYTNGIQMCTGTYGATGSGATYVMDDWFGGAGMLTVLPEPRAMLVLLLALLGLSSRPARRGLNEYGCG